MKLQVVLLSILVLSSVNAIAQSLDDAFSREMHLLRQVKESNQKLHVEFLNKQKRKVTLITNEVQALNKELALLTTQNEDLFGVVQRQESFRKEKQSKSSMNVDIYKKMQIFLIQAEQNLSFNSGNTLNSFLPNSEITMEGLKNWKDKAFFILIKANSIEDRVVSYRNKEGALVDGNVLSYGTIAAHSQYPDGRRGILVPNGEGMLSEVQIIQASQQSAILPIFFFDNINLKAKVVYKSGWMEKVADFTPVLFLVLLFSLVGGLFIALAKD